MIVLIIGLVLTSLMTYCILIAIPMSGANKTSVMMFLIMFLFTGIYMIIKGVKKVALSASISKNGKACFAMIKNIYQISDDAKVYNVEVAIYVEDTDTVEYTSFDSVMRFNKGDMLLVKYYNREVKIIDELSVNAIPIEIQKRFFSNETLKTTDMVTNFKIKPMDMPENGTEYEWENKDEFFDADYDEVYKGIEPLSTLICVDCLVSGKVLGKFAIYAQDFIINIPKFLEELKQCNHAIYHNEELSPFKWLCWLKNDKIRLIQQNYCKQRVRAEFDNLLDKNMFFDSCNKLILNLKQYADADQKRYDEYVKMKYGK